MAGNEFELLVAGDYDPFLVHTGYSAIKPVLGNYNKRFKCDNRLKGLAISDDARVWRMTIHKEKGYNDICRYDTDNALILEYVDGNEEESRRLHSLREGDEVRVTLDEKKNTISDNPEPRDFVRAISTHRA